MTIKNLILFMLVAIGIGSGLAGCSKKSGVTVGSLADTLDAHIIDKVEVV